MGREEGKRGEILKFLKQNTGDQNSDVIASNLDLKHNEVLVAIEDLSNQGFVKYLTAAAKSGTSYVAWLTPQGEINA